MDQDRTTFDAITAAKATLRAELEAEGLTGIPLSLVIVRHAPIFRALERYQLALLDVHAAQLRAIEASIGEEETPQPHTLDVRRGNRIFRFVCPPENP